MAKKKTPRPKSRDSNIGSSSLLPARSQGERPNMAFVIKSEPVENYDSVPMETDPPSNNPDIADLLSFITDAKHGTQLPATPCTELMENSISGSYQQSATENHAMPTSFAEVLVKQETPEVPDNLAECFTSLNAMNITAADQSNVREFVSNNYVENSENNVATPTMNVQVKEESIESNENSQDFNIHNMVHAPVNIQPELVNSQDINIQNRIHASLNTRPELVEQHENTAELENTNNEKVRKRKPELTSKIKDIIRKRVKREPSEDDENETRCFSFDSDQERKEMPGDNVGAEDGIKEEIIDHEIAVLTVPKIEKNIETITLSDDEGGDPQNSEEQDIDMECSIVEDISTFVSTKSNLPSVHCNMPVQPSAESLISQSASPKKVTQERQFSTEILKNFSVVSELDRYDCQTCLDSLRKKKIHNPLNNYFPKFKVERKSNSELQKGDWLFKKTTETHSDTKETSISQNDNNILQNSPVQCTAQSETERFSSSLLPSKTCSIEDRAPISQNADYNIPEMCQSTAKYPGIMPLSNLFQTPISSRSPNSMSDPSLMSNSQAKPDILSKNLLQNILNRVSITNKNGFANNQHPISNSNQVAEPRVISPLASLINDALTPFQMPSYLARTTFAATASSQASLHNHASLTITPLSNHAVPSYSAATTFAATGSSYSVPTTSFLHASPSISAVSSHSQESHDPRCAPNKPTFLPSSKIESSTLNRNTAVSFQPVNTLLNNNFQNLPGHSSSVNPSRQAASLSSIGARDPHTAVNRVSHTEFPPRKGKKDLSLYHNIGKDYITEHFNNLILQWNPEWMRIQEKTKILPPICESYKTVVYFYANEMDYYNTYVALHLLHVWYNIFFCWARRQYIYVPKCKVESVERLDNGFKISLAAELRNAEQFLPKNDDIVLCEHNKEETFLHVEDVKRKPTENGVKLKMTLRTLHNLRLNLDDEVSLSILYNTRTAFVQTEALNSLDNSMKELVLKPSDLLSRIEIVQLNSNQKVKDQRNEIIQVAKKPAIRVVLVQTYYGHDNVLLLTHVGYNILITFNSIFCEKNNKSSQVTTKKQSKVLIILKNDLLLEKLFKSLSQYEPILAVRTKQINLSPELITYTLQDLLERNNGSFTKISQKYHIFLTTVSAFGPNEKKLLSKMKDLICIIDDAHLCTEVETALPLTLKISKLLLVGNKDRSPDLPPALVDYKYYVTLFVRLMKAKKML